MARDEPQVSVRGMLTIGEVKQNSGIILFGKIKILVVRQENVVIEGFAMGVSMMERIAEEEE